MIDCDLCGKGIGSKAEPIFVNKEGSTVCRACCTESDGVAPNDEDAQFDPEDVSEEEAR
jgi:ribosome-binding protein aMBF1 (putative translation factor)